MRWFHGTSPESWEKIKHKGVCIDAPRRSDPGDLGWGFYLTQSLSRAKCYGSAVIWVEIDESRFANLPYPYFLDGLREVKPETEVEKLFYSLAFGAGGMLTVGGRAEHRERSCKRIREAFLDIGYVGITTPHSDGEAVVFSHEGILKMGEQR